MRNANEFYASDSVKYVGSITKLRGKFGRVTEVHVFPNGTGAPTYVHSVRMDNGQVLAGVRPESLILD